MSGGDNVKVCVRVRPLSDDEVRNGNKCVIDVDSARGTITAVASGGEPPKPFTFDCVFGSDSKQVDVYNMVARPIVEAVLSGYNGTIFAYGQTGTGKTFTMEGVRAVPELRGIIPNSFAHVFGHISRAQQDQKYLVRVSYLEIYQEEVRDLLGRDQSQHLEVKERPDTGVYVKDLSTCIVNNADDLDRVMTQGNRNRAVGATNMNAHSSRSHAIFTITVECSEIGIDKQQHVRVGKLHLVDLAGSERQSKTGATGERLKEATKINLSLSTLGNVISALVDGKSTHIPYRNSKLTRLLQDSLGGNSKTLMIANLGPADYNYDESVSTLRYANRAKNIKNQAKINEDPKDALLRQFQKEIEDLRRKLEEGGDYEEEDDGAGGGAGGAPRKRRGAGGKSISKDKMAEIQAKIEADQRRLEGERDMAAEEKRRVEADLQQHEEELEKAQDEQRQLMQRLEQMEKKVIVGGVNLLEKAAEQETMLEDAQKELEEREQQREKLAKALEEKDAERMDIEERYNSLQEEATGKTKKLKKLWTMYAATRAEMTDTERDHQRQMEELLDSIRQLSRELKLAKLVIDSGIPPEYQELIERNMIWSEDVADWQLRCVAYTGNNMRKQQLLMQESIQLKNEKEAAIRNAIGKENKRKTKSASDGPDDNAVTDLSNIYLAYSQDSAMRAVALSATAERGGGSGGNSGGGKPKSSGKRNKPR